MCFWWDKRLSSIVSNIASTQDAKHNTKASGLEFFIFFIYSVKFDFNITDADGTDNAKHNNQQMKLSLRSNQQRTNILN
jgi:hypothetical protein